MVATYEAYHLSFLQQAGGEIVHPIEEHFATIVDLHQFFAELGIVGHIATLYHVRYNELYALAQVVALGTDVFVYRQHVKAFLPAVLHIGIIEIYLHSSIEHILGATGGTGAVRNGNLPRYRQENKL